MKRNIITLLLLFCSLNVFAAEPALVDYTHYPVFMVESVKPNILILLDNSGSMNFNAYGPETNNGNEVTDAYYGAPYQNLVVSVSQDAEERISDGYTYLNSTDLDLGRDIDPAFEDLIVGLRYAGLNVPQGAEITNAYIEFVAVGDYDIGTTALQVKVSGEKASNSASFVSQNNDLSSRTKTVAEVDWAISDWAAEGQIDQTPNLKDIVQELINQSDWKEGNAISFFIEFNGENPATGRRAYSSEGNSQKAPKLVIEVAESTSKEYYGYFNPDYFYEYSNKFIHKYRKIDYDYQNNRWNVKNLSGVISTLSNNDVVAEGLWDGNWMNWMAMRRIDVLRKVLMGGLATSRTGGGNQVLYGESPPSSQSSRYFDRIFDSSFAAVTPYLGSYRYRVIQDDLTVDSNQDGSFTNADFKERIAVDKNINHDPEDFGPDGNLSGLFQDYFDKARWGLEYFNNGDGNNGSGGSVVRTIQDGNLADMLTTIQNKQCDTWTPLAESFYVGMQYYKQESADISLDYPIGAAPNSNDGQDPFIHNGEEVYCAKSFVLLLSDGASTKDAKIPAQYKDYDGDGVDNTNCNEDTGVNCDYPTGGTDYLDDLALYARTNDLRSDLPDDQNILLYTVYALSDDENARRLLMDAARNGGFEDFNGNNLPDGDYDDPPEDRLEWDRNGDGIPDTYFEATDGANLRRELGRAIEDILRRAASGTAVSVISTSAEGDGNLTQAFFRPVVEKGNDAIKWAGYLQNLWIDSMGNIREDTNQNAKLDINVDQIIRFGTQGNQTVVRRFGVSGSDPYPNIETANPIDVVPFDEINAIWDAGDRLWNRDAATRTIYTFLDKDKNQAVDSGEFISFSEANHTDIAPYLGVNSTLGAFDYLGSSHEDRTLNLLRFVRGHDSGFEGTTQMIRSRTIDGKSWKLGDIIYSSPVIVAAPQERYDQIYSDKSYFTYYNAFKNRETVVYTGANDGMLHAFTSWFYDKDNSEFINELEGNIITEEIGDELWAYIPQTLLPHLKWLADPDYTHVHYVDLTAKVFDAKILPDETHYSDPDSELNWGTFLLLGLNYGGKHIWVNEDFGEGQEVRHFYPTYTLIDVTDPRNPKVLWERSYSIPGSPAEVVNNNTDLGLTKNMPTVVKVDNDWFAVFGSGPADYSVQSYRKGHVYVVDLSTGAPFKNGDNDWLFETNENLTIMAEASSFDKDLNYSVDSIFIGSSFDNDLGEGLDWQGAMYKIRVPWSCSIIGACSYYGDLSNGAYDSDPQNWTMNKLMSVPRPVSSAPALSIDNKDNSWIYFGTGRFYTETDKSTTDIDYFIGVKDPFFNKTKYGPLGSDDYYLNVSDNKILTADDLFSSNDYAVSQTGAVFEMPSETLWSGSFESMVSFAEQSDGWKRALVNAPGERIINKPVVIGGTVLNTSFAPTSDICESGGNSYLYGLYYLTGTAFKKPVLTSIQPQYLGSGENQEERNVESIELGVGLSSSPTLHVGKQSNGEVTVFYQKSTGEVGQVNVNPAINPRSSIKSWNEERNN